AMVSLNSVRTDEDFASFQKSYIPIAVLLEGRFQSPFAYRLSQEVLDSLQRSTGKPFITQSVKPGKQIVVADGDIVTNMVSQTQGTMPMGMIPLENYRFANREFMLNCVDYLVSDRALYESRNKDFILRLLDKEKVARDRGMWQFIGIGIPVLMIVLIGLFINWRRKQLFA
ncbi:MAG: gliding motility-associated ABC transporter substrate-binding protein GldG, partial [Chitinophagaceae bacterium]